MVCVCGISGWIGPGRPLVHACLLSGFCVSEGKRTQTSRGKKKHINLNYYVDVGTWGVEDARILRISVHGAKKRVSVQTQTRWNHCTASEARVLQDRGEECEVTDKSYLSNSTSRKVVDMSYKQSTVCKDEKMQVAAGISFSRDPRRFCFPCVSQRACSVCMLRRRIGNDSCHIY